MNQIPDHVLSKMEVLVASCPLTELKQAFQRVSASYRARTFMPFASRYDRIAYLVYRLPATYAVALDVIARLKSQLPHYAPRMILDIGSGPGSMILAFESCFDSLFTVCAIEKDSVFIELGKLLVSAPTEWLHTEAQQAKIMECDTAIMSYCLGEMDEDARMKCLALTHKASYVIVIEPGTPVGYQTVMQARRMLINNGFSVVAPCPHSMACPMNSPDWCHFFCRLPRSKLHKLVKEGELGYEDEKFSYVVMAREAHCCKERIIGKAQHRSGHSRFTLCSHSGMIHEETISRKSPLYKAAKKAEWGDAIDL